MSGVSEHMDGNRPPDADARGDLPRARPAPVPTASGSAGSPATTARAAVLDYPTVMSPAGFGSSALMPSGAAWIDLAWMAAAMIGLTALLIVRFKLDFWTLPLGVEILAQPFALGAAMLALTLWRLRVHRQPAAAIGLGPRPWRSALGGGLAAYLTCLVLSLVTFGLLAAWLGLSWVEDLASERVESARIFASAPRAGILPLTLFVGVYEEIVFRGLLLSRLCVVLRGRVTPVLASSAVFGVLHISQGPIAVIQIFMMGVAFATFALRGRGIWPAVIAHVLWDLMAFGASFLITDLAASSAPSI